MRLVGHGLDVVEIPRLLPVDPDEAALFLTRCFRPSELAAVGEGPHRPSRLAARFAAKEAVLKALGTGWGDDIAFTDVEMGTTSAGAPTVALHGRCAEVATALGVSRWLLSLTHTDTIAVASAIAVSE